MAGHMGSTRPSVLKAHRSEFRGDKRTSVRFKRYVLEKEAPMRATTIALLVFFAPGPAASEPIALADLVGVLRGSEITLGPDVGIESPGTPFQPEALTCDCARAQ